MWERTRVESLARREECRVSWKVAGGADFEKVGGRKCVEELGGVYIGGSESISLVDRSAGELEIVGIA